MILATPPCAGCREKTMLRKTSPTMHRLTFPRRRQWTRAAVTPQGTRGREEKWRVLATSRREKRGRAFLRKVGREGIRLYTTRRACSDRSPGGRSRERRRRRRRPAAAAASRPCLKARARVIRPLSHVTVFRRADTDKSHTEFNLFGDSSCRNAARSRLAEASIR